MLAVGQKVKIVNMGNGKYNGEEAEVVEVSEAEGIKWPITIERFVPCVNPDDYIIIDGVTHRKVRYSVREGEVEAI